MSSDFDNEREEFINRVLGGDEELYQRMYEREMAQIHEEQQKAADAELQQLMTDCTIDSPCDMCEDLELQQYLTDMTLDDLEMSYPRRAA